MLILPIEEKFLRKDVQDFAIVGQSDVARGFHGAANVVRLHIARALAESDSAAAIHAAHVAAGNADNGGFDAERRRRLSASSTAWRIELTAKSKLTIWPLRQPFDSAAPSATNFTAPNLLSGSAIDGAGFRAADVEGYDLAVFLIQRSTPGKLKFFTARHRINAISPFVSVLVLRAREAFALPAAARLCFLPEERHVWPRPAAWAAAARASRQRWEPRR